MRAVARARTVKRRRCSPLWGWSPPLVFDTEPQSTAPPTGEQAGGRWLTERHGWTGRTVVGLCLALVLGVGHEAGAAEPVVRAVLFFFPRCGHCETVIYGVLPGLFEETGGQPLLRYDDSLPAGEVAFSLMTNGRLEILLVNTDVPDGADLYRVTTEAFSIPPGGVPRLVVGEQYLTGSTDIPERFPDIVRMTLASGDTIDWPHIPGLAEVVSRIPAANDQPVPGVQGATFQWVTATGPAGNASSMAERFGQDPVANSVSLVVLILMVVTLVGIVLRMRHTEHVASPGWAPALLSLAGFGIATYLAFVELVGSEAVCGPVGDCNTVQQSEFARLFGVIPVGVVGVVGYAVALTAWGELRLGKGCPADAATVLLFAGAAGGVLLSCYLTFLEAFVIGASCAWCLASAIIVTALAWLTARPASAAWSRIRSSL